MSVSAGLFITLASDHSSYSPMKILELLCQEGWCFNDHGLKAYLPINDNDNFDWTFKNITEDELLTILNHKSFLKELLGVVLTWQDSNIGGEFLLDPEGNIIISLSMYRQTFLSNVTDVNWYLQRIIPPITNSGLKVLSVKFEEHI